MPETLSLSTGVSLGLLAGVVSGVCYMIANGISWPSSEPLKKRCLTLDGDSGVCVKCGGDQRGGFLPCVCHVKEPVKFETGAWFLRQVQRAFTTMPWSLSTDKLEQIEEEYEGELEPRSNRDMRNVRDFLETLSAKLAGGPLDGTTVAPLYDHPACE